MATRSYIARKTSRGYQAVYTHWDGYPEHNGRILLDHYSDSRKLSRLLSHGDISVLTSLVGRKHKFENAGDVKSTTFYGRDRGEENVVAKSCKSLEQLLLAADHCGTEHVYLYECGSWYVASRGPQFFGDTDHSVFPSFCPLSDVLTSDSSTA